MTGKKKEEATGLSQVSQTLVSGKVRYLPLLLLLSVLVPMVHASTLPANVYIQNSTANPAIVILCVPIQ